MSIMLRENSQPEFCSPLQQGILIARKFRLLEKIGMGSFGIIYKTENIETGEICATKFEKISKNRNGVSLLVREIKVLMVMKGCYGFPQIGFYGRNQHYNYFIVNYLGYNFEQLVRKCGGRFKLDTCLNLAVQMLNRIQVLHSKNLIHRDIKPENLVIDFKDPSRLNIIDFGLSKYYKDTNGTHIPQTDKKGLIGTARFASVNSHKGNEQSRRDDMEAIGYVLVYLAKGELPWMNLQIDTYEEKLQKILETKLYTSMQVLCQGLPDCFLLYFQHIMSLRFTESPNYELLKESFQAGIKDIYVKTIQKFDWLTLQEFQNQDSSDNKIKQIDQQQGQVSLIKRRASPKKTLLQKQEENSNSILRVIQKKHSTIVRQHNLVNLDNVRAKSNQQNLDIQKQRSKDTPGMKSKNSSARQKSNMAEDVQKRKSRKQNTNQCINDINRQTQNQQNQFSQDIPQQKSIKLIADYHKLNVDTPGKRYNLLDVKSPGQRSSKLNQDVPMQKSGFLNVDTPGQRSSKLNQDISRNKSSQIIKGSPGQRSNRISKDILPKPSQFKKDSLLLQKNIVIRQNSGQKSFQKDRNLKDSQAIKQNINILRQKEYNQNNKNDNSPQKSRRKKAFRIDSQDEMKNKSFKKQNFSYESILKSFRDDVLYSKGSSPFNDKVGNRFGMNRSNRANSDQKSFYSNESLIMVIDMLSNISYSGNPEDSLKKQVKKKKLKKQNSDGTDRSKKLQLLHMKGNTVTQNHKYIREAIRVLPSASDFDEFDNLHLMDDKFDIIVNQSFSVKKLTNIMNS